MQKEQDLSLQEHQFEENQRLAPVGGDQLTERRTTTIVHGRGTSVHRIDELAEQLVPMEILLQEIRRRQSLQLTGEETGQGLNDSLVPEERRERERDEPWRGAE